MLCDAIGRDLQSMADYTQHPKHVELVPDMMQVTDGENGRGLAAVIA